MSAQRISSSWTAGLGADLSLAGAHKCSGVGAQPLLLLSPLQPLSKGSIVHILYFVRLRAPEALHLRQPR